MTSHINSVNMTYILSLEGLNLNIISKRHLQKIMLEINKNEICILKECISHCHECVHCFVKLSELRCHSIVHAHGSGVLCDFCAKHYKTEN